MSVIPFFEHRIARKRKRFKYDLNFYLPNNIKVRHLKSIRLKGERLELQIVRASSTTACQIFSNTLTIL